MFASGNEERLLGTETTFFDGDANFLPQFDGRVSEASRIGFSVHKISPFKSGTEEVPQFPRSGTKENARNISS
jgi:hypothetical protein